MTRNTERGIWIGVMVLLLLVGGVLLSPAGRMLGMCSDMMGDGMSGGGMMGNRR